MIKLKIISYKHMNKTVKKNNKIIYGDFEFDTIINSFL